jgi:hypothetical protein
MKRHEGRAAAVLLFVRMAQDMGYTSVTALLRDMRLAWKFDASIAPATSGGAK